jgi:hypothetical protein
LVEYKNIKILMRHKWSSTMLSEEEEEEEEQHFDE